MFIKKFFQNLFSHDQPKDFLVSQWQKNDKSSAYLLYRWILAWFFMFSVAFSIYADIRDDLFHVYFIYLTHLNLFSSMLVTWLGAILVTLHHFDIKEAPQKEMSQSLKVYWYLWNQTVVLACLITMFYWATIYKGQDIDSSNVLVHITNSITLIIDIFIVKHPPKFSNFISLIPIEGVYMLFTILYQSLGGLDKNGDNFVYSTTDWIRQPISATIYFFSFMLFSFILHVLINSINHLRTKLHLKRRKLQMRCRSEVHLEVV